MAKKATGTTIAYPSLKGVDPEKSRRGAGGGEPIPKGLYAAKVIKCELGYAKNSSGGPDHDRPRLEVQYEVTDKAGKGKVLYDYLPYSEKALWKVDQFLQAVGIEDEKAQKKRKNHKGGELDPSKVLGTKIGVNVTIGQNLDGDPRNEVGSVVPFSKDMAKAAKAEPAKDEDEDEDEEDDEELEDEDEESEDDEDEEEDEEEDDSDDREEELKALSKKELTAKAKELGVKTKGKDADDIIAEIIAAESEAEDEDEEEEDEDELVDEDEDEAPSKNKLLTKEQLKEMSSKELLKIAKDFDLEIEKGSKKSAVIKEILEAQGGDGEEKPPF